MAEKRKRPTRPFLICALIANAILFALGAYALYLNFNEGVESFKYYTVLSNAFSAVISGLFVIFASVALSRGKRVPKAVSVLRLIATSCLALTSAVALAVLAPEFGYRDMFLYGPRLFQHAVCPVISVFSFVAFERENGLSFRHVWLAPVPTALYGAVTVTLNYLGLLWGPYPFLAVNERPAAVSAAWGCALLAGDLLISWALYILARDKKQKLHK